MVSPKLTLVGAGPGDPELITLKGLKAIQQARVVLYDALVAKSLLDEAPNAIKIYVGKRAGQESFKQTSIQEMIVRYAYEYGNVVRLKGGDPFVFGRGSEEKRYAELYGIEVEIIQGISSAFAVPAAAGIPVTERGISEGVWVITGTTKAHSLSSDLALAAKSNSTVVVLMGTRKLSEIVKLFRNEGKESVPVAVIQNGTTKAQKQVVGTIADIELLAASNGVAAPGIIVIGEVVRSSHQLERIANASNVIEESHEGQTGWQRAAICG
jgi:uroporphyrin-III C-methyltransferase